MSKGLLIDYKWCTGCHSCEMACKAEHHYGEGQFGIRVIQMGPWKTLEEGQFDYNFVPIPTALCDLCEDRVNEGRLPTCVHHCQALVMEYGEVEELAKKAGEPGVVIFSVQGEAPASEVADFSDIDFSKPVGEAVQAGEGGADDGAASTDRFKIVSEVSRVILYDIEVENRFHADPEAVVKELIPEGLECSDEDFAGIVADVKERVVLWGRNTGVAAALEDD